MIKHFTAGQMWLLKQIGDDPDHGIVRRLSFGSSAYQYRLVEVHSGGGTFRLRNSSLDSRIIYRRGITNIVDSLESRGDLFSVPSDAEGALLIVSELAKSKLAEQLAAEAAGNRPHRFESRSHRLIPRFSSPYCKHCPRFERDKIHEVKNG